MARTSTAVALLALAAIGTACANDLPQLPRFQLLPASCGRVVQVQHDDTCDTIAGWAGITRQQFDALNPFLLCGTLPLRPGSAVCAGDTASYCNAVHVAQGGETCDSIAHSRGAIIGIDGAELTSCDSLRPGSRVCTSPDVTQCQKQKLCGVKLSPDMRNMLAANPDYCSIFAECQAAAELTEVEGQPSLQLTISSRTPAMTAALGNSGHPELSALAEALAADVPAALRVTLTPGWFQQDGSSMTAAEFGRVIASTSRKMLTSTWVQQNYAPTTIVRAQPYHT